MQHDAACLGSPPMLEYVDALPGTECRHAVDDRNRQLGLRQRRTHVRRHVISPLERVFVKRVAFRHEPCEKSFEIALHARIVVFLDQQAGGGMADVEREQSLAYAAGTHPFDHLRRTAIQALATGGHADYIEHLTHGRHCTG